MRDDVCHITARVVVNSRLLSLPVTSNVRLISIHRRAPFQFQSIQSTVHHHFEKLFAAAAMAGLWGGDQLQQHSIKV